MGRSIKTWVEKLLDDKFKDVAKQITEVRSEIAAVDSKVSRVDMETCKNFLVRYLADVERGEFVAEPEKQRFWEEYEHYTENGGNSYVKEWVERLKKEGKM